MPGTAESKSSTAGKPQAGLELTVIFFLCSVVSLSPFSRSTALDLMIFSPFVTPSLHMNALHAATIFILPPHTNFFR